MNIIIPVAGMDKSPDTPYIQSLREIERKTVLQYVVESLDHVETEHFLVIIRRADAERYHLGDIVRLLHPGAEVIVADGETMGAACTCMLAVDRMDLEKPLLITGSDQVLTVPMEDILDHFYEKRYDAGVVIFDDVHPKWSFVRLNTSNMVIEAAEKRPISRNATAGVFYFRRARDFINAAQKMIEKRAMLNGQYYICPALNEMILQQKRIGVYRVEKSQFFKLDNDYGINAYKDYLRECVT